MKIGAAARRVQGLDDDRPAEARLVSGPAQEDGGRVRMPVHLTCGEPLLLEIAELVDAAPVAAARNEGLPLGWSWGKASQD